MAIPWGWYVAICEDDVDIDRDRDLVCRFQAGDNDAFDALYVRYFARLTRFCAKRLEDPGDAEELAQETFARAYRALPRFKGEQRFYPWLTVIASRVCVDQYRSRSRAAKLPTFEDRGVDGGQDAVFDEVDRAHVNLAMQQLRPRHRDVLRLREELGWTYLSIAQHYDVTVGTVQLLIFRARHALRREYHAIAGDRASAAVPAFALLARFFGGAFRRARRAARVLGGAPIALQPVAALVVVVGATMMVLGSPRPVTSMPRAASAPPAIAVDRFESASKGVTVQPTTQGELRDAGSAPGAVPVPGLRSRSADDLERDAEGMPVRAQVRGVTVGADPDATAADTTENAQRYADDLGLGQ